MRNRFSFVIIPDISKQVNGMGLKIPSIRDFSISSDHRFKLLLTFQAIASRALMGALDSGCQVANLKIRKNFSISCIS